LGALGFGSQAAARCKRSRTLGGESGLWRPYLKVNLWHTFEGQSDVLFGFTDTVSTQRAASALEIGAGVTGQVNTAVAVYGGLSYTTAIGITERRGVQGQLGMRVRW
jgi:outer membrane autotransporter protein